MTVSREISNRMRSHARQGWPRGRHIAVLNWRDGEHPQAGGAETYCLSVARWLVANGARVTLVTSQAPGQARRSVVDGIEIHRGGGQFGVYLHVLLWLVRRRPVSWLGRRSQIDAVLDCQNGIPFFAPLALGREVPVVLLIHHVHQEQFTLHFGRRLARIGQFLEGPASRAIYADRPTVCVSPSTRAEVRRSLRFRNPIFVVPNGGPAPHRRPRGESLAPSAVSVGRLVVQKHVDELLVAVAEARAAVPDLVFHVVGDGPEAARLKQQARQLGLEEAVIFHGRVSAAERDALLEQSWLFLSASHREGWGVAVLEAAAHGVPALARDVPGLRDAIRDGITGWLVGEGGSLGGALVEAIEELRLDGCREAMAENCYAWAENFSWDRSAHRVSAILEHEWLRIQTRQPSRRVPDLVTRVEVDFTPADPTAAGVGVPVPAGARLTDEWHQTDAGLVGLLYGTDEQGAAQALLRMGLDPHSATRIARSHDLLGELPRGERVSAIDMEEETC